MRSKSSIITERAQPKVHSLAPVHPGEVLNEEFLQALGITQYRLAKETNVPPRRINEIVHAKRAITADTAIRLAKFFGTSEMFWLNLQARFDLDVQREKLGSRASSVRPFQAPRTSPPVSRASKAAVTSSRSGAVRSGYRRKAK